MRTIDLFWRIMASGITRQEHVTLAARFVVVAQNVQALTAGKLSWQRLGEINFGEQSI